MLVTIGAKRVRYRVISMKFSRQENSSAIADTVSLSNIYRTQK